MTKAIHASRIGLLFVGAFIALFLVLSTAAPMAHAALVLDSTTTGMLVSVVSGTQNLMNTVQVDINAHMFTPSQSAALSVTLGGIGTVLGNISAIIGGVSFPNTGYSPLGV